MLQQYLKTPSCIDFHDPSFVFFVFFFSFFFFFFFFFGCVKGVFDFVTKCFFFLGTNPLSLHKTQLSNVNSEQEPELVA